MLTRDIMRTLRKTRFLTEPMRANLEADAVGDPRKAYQYARLVVGGPWPTGEAVIAEAPKWSCYYASQVLQGRFEAGEYVLAQSRVWFRDYWSRVLHYQWPNPLPWALEHAKEQWGNELPTEEGIL